MLQHAVPELIVVLPANATTADAAALTDGAFGQEQVFPGPEHVHVAQVLVHDLLSTVSSATPSSIMEAVALEGIPTDALGDYDARAGDGELELGYTGPALGDRSVDIARGGMPAPQARPPPTSTSHHAQGRESARTWPGSRRRPALLANRYTATDPFQRQRKINAPGQAG